MFNVSEHFKPFVEVDERCEVHDCLKVLVQMTNKTACRLCVEAEVRAREQKMAQEDYERSMTFKRDYYLYTFPEVNEELREATFQNFVPETKAEEKVKSEAVRITGDYIRGSSHNTIFLGGAGAGKSHLAYAMIKNYVKRTGKIATIANFPDLLNRLKSDFKEKANDYLAKVIDVDLLVLDDLGAERQSEWTDEILYQLLDKRSRTIITTNLTSEELQKRYDKRTVSRISKGAKGYVVDFKGIKDKRGDLFG